MIRTPLTVVVNRIRLAVPRHRAARVVAARIHHLEPLGVLKLRVHARAAVDPFPEILAAVEHLLSDAGSGAVPLVVRARNSHCHLSLSSKKRGPAAYR